MTIAKNIDPTDIVRLHDEGLSTSQIASALGIKAPTVSYWKRKLGITLVDTKKDWNKIQEAHNAGASYDQLGKQFGVTKRALQMARERGDFKVREIPRVTEEHKRGIKREAWARYNARKKYNTPHDEDLSLIQEFYKNCPKGYEVDHIIPISKGGLHSISNLQYLTQTENRKKSNKLL